MELNIFAFYLNQWLFHYFVDYSNLKIKLINFNSCLPVGMHKIRLTASFLDQFIPSWLIILCYPFGAVDTEGSTVLSYVTCTLRTKTSKVTLIWFQHSSFLVLCQQGSYISNGQCERCPAGQFQPFVGQAFCWYCPGGWTTNAEIGATQCNLDQVTNTIIMLILYQS